MKIAVYSYREDEKAFFDACESKYGVELLRLAEDPLLENVGLVQGCQAMNVTVKTQITAEMMDAYQSMGLQYLSTRTVGFEHLDMVHAEKIGLAVGNAGYPPNSVAEYAVMMMLMSLRHMKTILTRYQGQDYSLVGGIRGRVLHGATVGIVGTGKIGTTVAQILQGFGCKLLATDVWENPALSGVVHYVPLETLLAQSDVVTLHAPSSAENFQLLNAKTLAMMQPGAILVNTARGDLIDTDALIDALESGHLGGAALDVVEDDRLIYYRDKKNEQLCHRQMALLQSMPNVVMTPHTAFFTDLSVSNMVENSIRACIEHVAKGE